MNSFLTKDQMISLGVKVIGIIGGALVTKGLATADQISTLQTGLPTLVGAAMTIYTLLYSLWKNRPAKQIADVAKKADVSVTVASPELAAKVAKVDPNATVAAQ